MATSKIDALVANARNADGSIATSAVRGIQALYAAAGVHIEANVGFEPIVDCPADVPFSDAVTLLAGTGTGVAEGRVSVARVFISARKLAAVLARLNGVDGTREAEAALKAEMCDAMRDDPHMAFVVHAARLRTELYDRFEACGGARPKRAVKGADVGVCFSHGKRRRGSSTSEEDGDAPYDVTEVDADLVGECVEALRDEEGWPAAADPHGLACDADVWAESISPHIRCNVVWPYPVTVAAAACAVQAVQGHVRRFVQAYADMVVDLAARSGFSASILRAVVESGGKTLAATDDVCVRTNALFHACVLENEEPLGTAAQARSTVALPVGKSAKRGTEEAPPVVVVLEPEDDRFPAREVGVPCSDEHIVLATAVRFLDSANVDTCA